MPSVFISYSQDPDAPSYGDRVAGLAASLMQDGLRVFFDQNRCNDEEGVPWPIWMEDKIEIADHVLLVCSELYLKKIRQEVPSCVGRGVLWEANLIYNRLYLAKLNTTKFVPVLFSPDDERFVPTPLQGTFRFVLDSNEGYLRLFAFLTGQHHPHFPDQGASIAEISSEPTTPLFDPVTRICLATDSNRMVSSTKPPTAFTASHLTLKTNPPPPSRWDLRGLDWYDESDADHFLGRDEDVQRFLPMLLSHPVIRLTGPSGVGKSSLIRAGLLPQIREFGWRACVIRPFGEPAKHLPAQLTEALLTGEGEFTTPLNPTRLREELASVMARNNVFRLVLFLDQFEDIVSPLAAPDAVETLRELLRELWDKKDLKPALRAVVVYRTDAEARLGRLWQEISGRADGLPYMALEGLTRPIAERILTETAQVRAWTMETGVAELVRQLAQESRRMDCAGEIYPVYLQILLRQAEACPDGRLTASFLGKWGGVSGIIGKYLEQSLAQLTSRGGDWIHCGAVLESLSRANGTKAALSLDELVRETGINPVILAEMMPVLVNERLVRPIGHQKYEIQHDRLAAAVIENLKDSDREAKTARDFLAAKALAFQRAMTPLGSGDLLYLYSHRYRIHPSETELRIILASMSTVRSMNDEDPIPGWFWFRDATVEQWWDRVLQIERWACQMDNELQSECLWAFRLPAQGMYRRLEELAKDPLARMRSLCVILLGRTSEGGRLTLLRELAKDKAPPVRKAAAETLARASVVEDLPLLWDLSKDEDAHVRRAVASGLRDARQPQALPLLKELAKNEDPGVRHSAALALAELGLHEDFDIWRLLARDSDKHVRCTAAKALASQNTILALPLLGDLAKDQDPSVRLTAAKAIAGHNKTLALPLLRDLAKDHDPHVCCAVAEALIEFGDSQALTIALELAKEPNVPLRMEAANIVGRIASVEQMDDVYALFQVNDSRFQCSLIEGLAAGGKVQVLPLLRKLVEDQNWNVRTKAATAIVGIAGMDGLAHLRHLSQDANVNVRCSAAQALGKTRKPAVLPLLRQLSKEEDESVRSSAVEALACFARARDLPLFRELTKDEDSDVRAHAVDALASFGMAEDLPILYELAEDENETIRRAVARSLKGFDKAQGLPLLTTLLKDTDEDVAAEALNSLRARFSLQELDGLFNQYEDDFDAATICAFDRLLYMPDWLKCSDVEADSHAFSFFS